LSEWAPLLPNKILAARLAAEMKEAEAKPVKAGGRLCCICNKRRAALKRPKTVEQVTLLPSLSFIEFTVYGKLLNQFTKNC
jgi:hypothetical protein